MKKTLSVILSLVLAFSCLTAIVPFTASAEAVDTSEVNLIVNPGFEDGMTGWSKFYGNSGEDFNADAVTTEKNSGEKSLHRWIGDAAINNQLLYQNITLEPYAKYTLSFWIKGEPKYGRVYVTKNTDPQTSIDAGDQNNTTPENNAFFHQWMATQYDEWTKLTYTFTAGEATDYLLAFLCASANTDFYIDDFSLVEENNLITNPGFEDGFNGWSKLDPTTWQTFNAQVVTDEKNSGNASLHRWVGETTTSNQLIAQTVKLEANTNYTFSFYIKGNIAWSRFYITSATDYPTVIDHNNTDNKALWYQWSGHNFTEWTKLSYTFTSLEATDYLLGFMCAAAGVDIYLDDFVLEKDYNIIADGGFEGTRQIINDDLSVPVTDADKRWISWDGEAKYRTNDGTHKVRTDSVSLGANAATYVFTDITVEPDTTYELGAYVNGTHTTWGFAVQNLTYIEGTEGYDASTYEFTATEYSRYNSVSGAVNYYGDYNSFKYTASDSDWVKSTAKFTTAANQTKARVFVFVTGGLVSWGSPTTYTYLDDVYVIENDNIINNSGYESGMAGWNTWWSPETEISTTEKHSGANSIRHYVSAETSQYGRVVYQNVKLAPYTEYTLTFWLKGHAGWGQFYVIDTTVDPNSKDSTANILLKHQYDGTNVPVVYDDWTKVTYTFSSKDVTDNRLAFYFASPDTDIYIDDIELKATGKVGDFNGSGKADADDAVTMKKYLIGADSGLADTAVLNITEDTEVNIIDLIRLKKILAALA